MTTHAERKKEFALLKKMSEKLPEEERSLLLQFEEEILSMSKKIDRGFPVSYLLDSVEEFLYGSLISPITGRLVEWGKAEDAPFCRINTRDSTLTLDIESGRVSKVYALRFRVLNANNTTIFHGKVVTDQGVLCSTLDVRALPFNPRKYDIILKKNLFKNTYKVLNPEILDDVFERYFRPGESGVTKGAPKC